MSGTPRICFLTGTLNAYAGAERMTAVMANALAERGFPTFVLSLWDRHSCFPLVDGVSHHALFARRPSFKRAYPATVAGIRRFLKAHRIDILVEVDTMLALFTLPASVGLPVRKIAWEHCFFDQDLGRPMRRVARRLAARFHDDIVVLTDRDHARWEEALQPRANVLTVPNPLPFAFPPDAATRKAKVVLAVGRLTHAKGFDILLRAWAMVAERAPDWRLIIAGEGESRPELERLRAQLGLAESVELPGAREDVSSLYQGASVFCLSSRYEGFGLVLLEAMSHGLPVVSTDCEAGPRALLSDREALLVPTENPEALASAITALMDNTAVANDMALAGRQKARDFELGRIVDQWQQLLCQH
ncbi:glycosyltransferase family 4 protein [Cupriavidus agavae]|uniref:Glycosyltransferase involved in cell wall biosynthesis n=1 Tax=Cupriavidus agavae TaxID=1001822 RepID=A0A4Q7S4I3_9BURK|nr:glycosyltransferase family 4 protein [Cupriavidus agavae]RZT41354.1 glycosyltransferase involved in cell wall biosynthesis [Cupriavidus agavae]